MGRGDVTDGDRRRARILQELADRGRVEVRALSACLAVAEETVRRDLRTLQRRGLLTRAHGGAIPVRSEPTQPAGAAAMLARAVVARLPEIGSIYLDSGSASQSIAALLPDRAGLRVPTCSVPVALQLSELDLVEVYSVGGTLRGDGGLSGDWSLHYLDMCRFDAAVLTAEASSTDGMLLAPDPASAELKRLAISESAFTVAVVASRSETGGMVGFGWETEMDVVVSLADAQVSG